MLTTLRISGFAIVDAVEVNFAPGLNVLTGETGAGKSLLVNALHLVLGGRMSAEVLRDGAEEAVVEALFELPADHPVFGRLEAAGVPSPGPAPGAGACAAPGETAELLVRRVATRGGRGRAYVNGALVTATVLAEALRGVVDVSGQHEHVSLLDEATHLALLDAFAGTDDGAERGSLGPLRARYGEAFAALAALCREREALRADDAERGRRADYLAFQLRELDGADPRAGEDVALDGERRVLLSAERLREGARGAEALVYGEDGAASERVGQAVRVLVEAASLDARLQAPLELLRSAAIEIDEAGRELARYADAVAGDPERLREVEERLEVLRAIARKHGGSLEAALARRAGMAAELAALQGGGDRLLALEPLIEGAGKEAAALAGQLSRSRRKAARAFSEAVQQELAGLAMARCRLEVVFASPEGGVEVAGVPLGPDGAEQARFLLAPNPGETPRPLARIASGGELSRILLAVKRTLARRDPVLTYVFDEVDSGIGGAVAEAMGRVLAEVARGRQVLCVTHLPQIAAFADRHHRVQKRVAAGRTSAEVVPLEAGAARCQEVARMLAGATVTGVALAHAEALIAAAHGAVHRAVAGGDAEGGAEAPSRGRRGAGGRAAARVAGRG